MADSQMMVQVFAPDGSLGDIPYENLHAAVRSGAKPAVHVKAPDGSLGFVPADRMEEATKAGATVVPMTGDEGVPQKQGFLGAFTNDVRGMAEGALNTARSFAGPFAVPGAGQFTNPGMSQQAPSSAAALEADQQRAAAGNSALYRGGALLATGLGANVQGMEDAAQQGDPGAVLGHAAAGAAPYVAGVAAKESAPYISKGATQVAGEVTGSGPKAAGGELFNTVKAAVKDVPVTLDKSVSGASELIDWSRKTNLGPTVNKFLNRITDPNKGALTYSEARDWYSLLGGLSAEDATKLGRAPKAALQSMLAGLKEDIGNAAQSVGQGQNYYEAMNQFAKGARRADRFETLAPWVKKGIVTGVAGAAGWNTIRRLSDLLGK